MRVRERPERHKSERVEARRNPPVVAVQRQIGVNGGLRPNCSRRPELSSTRNADILTRTYHSDNIPRRMSS